MQNMVEARYASVVPFALGFLLGFLLALSLLCNSPIAKVDENRVKETVIPASNTVVNYTVADLPEGWKLYENQDQYRLKDPTGTNRFPLMWFDGERREYRGNFTSIHKAVSDAIEHQSQDDLKNDKKWEPVSAPKEPSSWMPENVRYPDWSKIAFSSVFELERCCDAIYSSGKSSNEVYTFYTNQLRMMREQNNGRVRLW